MQRFINAFRRHGGCSIRHQYFDASGGRWMLLQITHFFLVLLIKPALKHMPRSEHFNRQKTYTGNRTENHG
ncbi:hypothetical protein BM547_28670 [Pseudomonas aeruginosa]|nr:hypothetical protein BM547_28670 [Pseudomonas aeruginosa]RLR81469.1 hypothetical protein CKA49_17280 [Pseudomonas aeruginosa]